MVEIELIKQHVGEWLAEASLGKPPVVYEIELRERIIRVEEELHRQRDLIQQVLEQMDRRFDEINRRLDRFRTWPSASPSPRAASSSPSSSSGTEVPALEFLYSFLWLRENLTCGRLRSITRPRRSKHHKSRRS